MRTRKSLAIIGAVVIAIALTLILREQMRADAIAEPKELSAARPVDSRGDETQSIALILQADRTESRAELTTLPGEHLTYSNPMPEPVDSVWHRLYPSAQAGDANAAYELAKALALCKRVTKALDGRGPRERRQLAEQASPIGNPAMAGELAGLFENCQADPGRLDSAADWMMQAASAGHEAAALAFYSVAVGAYEPADAATRDWYTGQATKFLSDVRDSGNIAAAVQLSRVTLTSDPEIAYANSAFIVAYLQSGSSEMGEMQAAYLIQFASGVMSEAQEALSPAEIRRALNLADQYFVKCCRSAGVGPG